LKSPEPLLAGDRTVDEVITMMSSVYTVSEVEQVIVTQFGKPVGEAVKAQGGQQTCHAFGNVFAGLDQRVVLSGAAPWQDVQPRPIRCSLPAAHRRLR
jgi:regulator of protease activity HflC (stomatin/prohibitin superfamily)